MNNKTIVIGITGSVGMGKSTLTGQCAELGAKTCNSDMIVHQLLAKGGAAVEAVGKQFPKTVVGDAVDRKALGAIVFYDQEKLKLLESILHPLVAAEEERFIAKCKGEGAPYAVLDIPLLFETGAEKRCNAVIVASAPPFIQAYRVMKRPGMTAEKFTRILARQMPSSEKRKRADFVVQTGFGRAYSFYQLKQILRKLHARNHP